MPKPEQPATPQPVPPVQSPTSYSGQGKKKTAGFTPVSTFMGKDMTPDFSQMGNKTLIGQ
jgi:hypothetical protein